MDSTPIDTNVVSDLVTLQNATEHTTTDPSMEVEETTSVPTIEDINDKENADKTVEGEKNAEPIDTSTSSSSHQSSFTGSEVGGGDGMQKTSRELKSILALSKEARLSTNLANRRKTIENKKRPSYSSKSDDNQSSTSDDIQQQQQRRINSGKVRSFPVTAECELETDADTSSDVTPSKKIRYDYYEAVPNTETKSVKASYPIIGKDLRVLKPNKDLFCWRCNRGDVEIACATCPRAYHQKCLKQIAEDGNNWACPECVAILKAENTETRSKAMKEMTLDHLCRLLRFAVKRMIACPVSAPFVNHVDEKEFPEYKNYIINPMTLLMLEKNIKNNVYGSTQAFESDARWILHNSIIFNSYQSRLTANAKTLLKICKQEMAEIENCSSCYLNANTKKKTWFVEVCPKPHLLVWAKLKGFPYWPAKVMSVTPYDMVDVRFFGAHDRSWVHARDCLLYCVKDPNSTRHKKNDIMECVKELELYVENLKKVYGKVVYAGFKAPLNPNNLNKYLQQLLPNYKEGLKSIQDKPFSSSLLKSEHLSESSNQSSSDMTESSESSDESDDQTFKCGTENNVEKSPKDIEEERARNPVKIKIITKKIANTKHSISILPSEENKCLGNESLQTNNNTVQNPQNNEVNNQEKLVENECTEKQDEVGKSPPKLRIINRLFQELESTNSDEKSTTVEKVVSKDDLNVNKTQTEKPPNLTESNKNPIPEKKSVSDKVSKSSEDKIKNNCDSVKEQSVNNVENVKKSSTSTENNIQQKVVSNPTTDNTTSNKSNSNTTKSLNKRQLSQSSITGGSQSTDSNTKRIKLIPIENILEKKSNSTDSSQSSSNTPKDINSDKTRSANKKNDKANTNDKTVNKNQPVVTIKVECDSDEDTDYMEAKRQYLSALNISEKSAVLVKKPKEIRTRSKTEVRKNKADNATNADGKLEKIVNNSISTADSNNSNNKIVSGHAAVNDSTKKRTDKIYIKPLSKLHTPKYKARKSFPTPTYASKHAPSLIKRNVIQQRNSLPQSQQKFVDTQMSSPAVSQALRVPTLRYINKSAPSAKSAPAPTLCTVATNSTTTSSIVVNAVRSKDNSGSAMPSVSNNSNNMQTTLTGGNVQVHIETELPVLKDILPDNVTKGINDILYQPPPKLKPKPPAPIAMSSLFEVNSSSSVLSTINDAAQKLSDFFRDTLTNTIEVLGSNTSTEATIANLRREVEELKYKHSVEMMEIRRNVSILLKDIQKSVVEERQRAVGEARITFDKELKQKVEEAKSKQWCANCFREAQFYCCWNTSYCDYPCQQMHWLQHMTKCTQQNLSMTPTSMIAPSSMVGGPSSTAKTPPTTSIAKNSSNVPGHTLTSKPRTVANNYIKPHKVYVKKSSLPIKPGFPTSSIALVESTPGNFELLSNGPLPLNGKILAPSSIVEKIKSGNISVTSPTRSGGKDAKIAPKPSVSMTKTGNTSTASTDVNST